MSRNKKIVIGLVIVAVLGAIAFANFKFKPQAGVAVNVETVQARDLQQIVSASGKIQPHQLVNISADTVGRVTDLKAEEGQVVKKGQFLMQIDPKLLASAAQQAESSLAAAKSTMEQLRVAADSAKAAAKQAQDAFTRQQQLWKQGLTTKETLDNAESTLRMRQSDSSSAEKQIETQRLRMQQEQAGLDSAKYTLSKVRIESPIDGIITKRNIEEGETVVVGTMNNAGTQLLTIADMTDIEAQVEVDETDIPNVLLGQPAKITIDAMPGKSFTGKVVEIGNSPIEVAGSTATSASQATNFLVKVKVDGTIPDVRPGFTCTAEITTATRKSVVSIPIQATTVREMVVDKTGAIVRDPASEGKRRPTTTAVQALRPGDERKEIEGVFIVQNNKAQFVAVKTGVAGEKYFEVLTGVKAGDQVIVGPFSSVRELGDGAPVKIEAPTRSATGAKT